MKAGTRVRIVADNMGVVESLSDRSFSNVTVKFDHPGVYVGKHPNVDGWHVVSVEVEGRTYFVPCHTAHFEVV